MSTVTEELDKMRKAFPAGRATVLLNVIDKARELHSPVNRGRVMFCCAGCEDGDHPDCCHEWPCPTIDAITAALGAGRDGRTA